MGRHQENPVRLYFSYDPVSNKSRCRIEGCTAEIAGNHGGNLQRHVQRIHPSAFATLLAPSRFEDSPTPSSSAPKRPLSNGDGQRSPLDSPLAKQPRKEAVQLTPDSLIDACVELVTVNGRPFSLMDDTGFRKIIYPVLEAMGKSVVIDSETIRDMVSEVAEREREQLRKRLKGKLLMLKVDTATCGDRTALAVNVQYAEGERIALLTLAIRELPPKHTDSYVSAVVREVLKAYGVDLKQLYSITVDHCTTAREAPPSSSPECRDDGVDYGGECSDEEERGDKDGEDDDFTDTNAQQARETGDCPLTLDLYETSGNVTGELHSTGGGGPILRGVRCSAHTFQLALEEALKDRTVADLVAKARHVSKKLSTPNVSGFLRRLGQRRAIVDRPNQWLSTLDMLERLCVLKTFCEDMSPTIPELHLKGSEWDEISQLVWALKPAKAATILFQFEQLTAGDFFGAWLKCKIETDKIGGPFAALLVECLNRCQHTLLENEAFLAAVFLDPRYKVLLTEAQTDQAKVRLCRAWGTIQMISPNASPSPLARSSEELASGDADDEIEEMLRARERESGDEGVKCKTLMMSVLNAYSSEERLKREENVFNYWLSISQLTPDLFTLAMSVIPLPVTQVSLERAVSGLRYILSLKTKMNSDVLEDVLFVRLNKQFGM